MAMIAHLLARVSITTKKSKDSALISHSNLIMTSKTIDYDRQQLIKVEEEIRGILNSGAYIECQYFYTENKRIDTPEKVGVSKVWLVLLHRRGRRTMLTPLNPRAHRSPSQAVSS